MRATGLRIDIIWLFALLVSTVFAYAIATGFWLGVAAVGGGLVLVVLALTRPLALTMLWVIGFPTVFVLINNMITAVPVLTVERALFLLLAGLLVAHALLNPDSLRRPGAIEKAMLLYLGVVLISWFTTFGDKTGDEIKNDVVQLGEGLLMPFTAFLLARNTPWTQRLAMQCLVALLLTVGLYEVMAGLAQYYLDLRIFQPPDVEGLHADRMNGTFLNSLPYGIVLATLYFVALFCFLHSKGAGVRALMLAVGLALLLCIVLSKGRAVWLAMIVANLYVFLRCRPIRPLLGAAAVIGLVSAPVVLPLFVNFSELSQRLGDNSPVYNRITAWATSVEMIKDRPLFGFGYGSQTFGKYKSDYYSTWGNVPASYATYPVVPHNEFLNVLVMMGLPGLAAFCLLLWALWRTLAKASKPPGAAMGIASDLAIFVQAAFIVVVVNLLFMDMVGNPYVMVLILFLIGVATRLAATPGAAQRDGQAKGRSAP